MTSWFFIEMAAKSALICAVALPLIDFAFPSLQVEAFPAPAMAEPAGRTAAQFQAPVALAAAPRPSARPRPGPAVP